MTEPLSVRPARRYRRGSASIEYVLVTVAVITALFLPIAPGGESAIDIVLEALRGFQHHTTHLLSLP